MEYFESIHVDCCFFEFCSSETFLLFAQLGFDYDVEMLSDFFFQELWFRKPSGRL